MAPPALRLAALLHLAARASGEARAAETPTALVVESPEYAAALRASVRTPWVIAECGASGAQCTSPRKDASVVIGRADAVPLAELPALRLVQGVSYFHTDFSTVPSRAAIASAAEGFWPAYGADQIAEWAIAAIFESQYRLSSLSRSFVACAFNSSDAPSECAADSTATNHTMVSELTIGVLGYGNIGTRVAQRAAAMGSPVVATKRHGPFTPPPSPLKWLSDDNDRLLREADVVVLTVPGSGHASTIGLINETSLALMKDGALLIPTSAGPVDYTALERALRARPSLRAVVDVWTSGCWHFPNTTCGPPLGHRNWPAESAGLASLPNVLPLPGVSMRDAKFWQHSVKLVAGNLDALAQGRPLAGVVRNASKVDGVAAFV